MVNDSASAPIDKVFKALKRQKASMPKFPFKIKPRIDFRKLNIFKDEDWNRFPKVELSDMIGKPIEPWNIFAKEAERWHKIATKLKLPLKPVGKASKKSLRLTFNNKRKSLLLKLVYLYGEEKGRDAFDKIEKKILNLCRKKPTKLKYADAHFDPINRFTEKDVVLITYPDSLQEKGDLPLRTLKRFATSRLKDISTIHILPFYPYSSDRGFSVINYKKVEPRFGGWGDIEAISRDFNLMFDGVFNHISSKSMWFKKFLKDDPRYKDHFIAFESKDAISKEDMAKIVRPRTSPLLSEFKSSHGPTYIWTTFSRDQIDLNYKETRVLLRIVDVIFRYVRHGASLIRLDAINYIWKELGTSCVHLKQTHVVVQLIRDILDIAAPSVSLITETNVPHAQNIKYFGNGRNEAQMVYNFALPPLVLYTFYKGNTKYISRWADKLERISPYCTYYNFLGSHDGIGLTPVKRVLPQKEVKYLIKEAKKHGSLVKKKMLGSGVEAPYELNITWWSAINNEHDEDELQVKRYMASRALAMSLKGVPAVYIHGLFGTKNDSEAVSKSKSNRDINRKDLLVKELEKELDGNTLTSEVFSRMIELIRIRKAHAAFHPGAEQQILDKNGSVFSLLRTSIKKDERMLVLINVTGMEQEYTINCRELGLSNSSLYDVLNKKKVLTPSDRISINEFDIRLDPYDALWIRSTA